MRLPKLLLMLFAALALLPSAAYPATTPTEARALAAARKDHAAYTLPAGELVKAKALARTRHLVYWADTVWSLVALWLILQLRIAARMEAWAVRLSRRRWMQGLLFVLQLQLLMTLAMLPIAVFEQRTGRSYGLSVQSWGSWLGDEGKSFALETGLGGLGVLVLFWLIRRSPRSWWAWSAAAVMGLSGLGVFATPYVIDPLFNRFEPLAKSNPALVEQLERVVAKGNGIEIPPERMFLMRASDKVTTLNAYVTGFGASKRVVVWDTSIEKGTPDEILFIFGHEMGHYVLGHIGRSLLFSFALILIGFWAGFHVFRWLLRRFGLRWGVMGQEHWSSLVIMVLVLSGLGFVVSPIASAYSRSNEHAADVYGQEVVHGIVRDPQATGRAGFEVLGENSLDDPTPAPFYEYWVDSHPPIWLRSAFAERYDPWAAGEAPKYFRKQP